MSEMSEFWTHVPGFIPSYVFQPFYEILKEYTIPITRPLLNGRVSCMFMDIHNTGSTIKYDRIKNYKWSEAPSILQEICKLVEQYTGKTYDYVLAHIYPSGISGIGWHSDSEALTSDVVSISMGAARKFRFRKIGRTKGYDHEILLKDGDLLIMKGPDPAVGRPSCQEVFMHGVPVEKKVKTPRINLTFRQYSVQN